MFSTQGGYVNFTEPNGEPVLSGLQILTLRRHGFVSLRPKDSTDESGGTLLTRPLQLPKCNAARGERLRLELNLDTAMTGTATVEIVPIASAGPSEAGAGGEAAKSLRSIVLVGNSAHLAVQFAPFERDWEADVSLPPPLEGAEVQLSFVLAGNADLYGFQFVCGLGAR